MLIHLSWCNSGRIGELLENYITICSCHGGGGHHLFKLKRAFQEYKTLAENKLQGFINLQRQTESSLVNEGSHTASYSPFQCVASFREN